MPALLWSKISRKPSWLRIQGDQKYFFKRCIEVNKMVHYEVIQGLKRCIYCFYCIFITKYFGQKVHKCTTVHILVTLADVGSYRLAHWGFC